MSTKRIEGLGLLFAAGLSIGASCDDGPIAPDPEILSLAIQSPVKGSKFLVPVSGDTGIAVSGTATCTPNCGQLALSWKQNGRVVSEGQSGRPLLPSGKDVELVFHARTSRGTEATATTTYSKYEPVRGRVITLDQQASAAAASTSVADLTVSISSAAGNGSVQTDSQGKFAVSTWAVEADRVERSVSASSTYYGAFDTLFSSALSSESQAILIPRIFCITEGTFAGSCIKNDLVAFFRTGADSLRYIGRDANNGTRGFRPGVVRIIFNDSIAKITAEDTAAFLANLRAEAKKLGKFRSYVIGASADSVVGIIEVIKEPGKPSGVAKYDTIPGVIKLCRLYLQDFARLYLAVHEGIGHCEGLGHLIGVNGACPFPSAMADGCPGPDTLTVHDVGVIQQLSLQAELRWQYRNANDAWRSARNWAFKNENDGT